MKQIISIAPGRACLFGDHQDYIGLPVIACAINRYIKLTAVENGLDVFNIKKPDINKERKINIYNEISFIQKGDNIISALKVLRRYGCIPNKGYDILIRGNLPVNAGISSSSAVVVAWVNFLIEAFGLNIPITPETISQIAFEAEVLEHGNPGGKMDQFSIGLGNVLYMETGKHFSYEKIHTSLDGIIIGESGIPKSTISLLNELKEKTWLAINNVKANIKDFDIKNAKKEDLKKYLNHLSDKLQPFLVAAIKNHDITERALIEFKNEIPDLKKIGALMTEHHNILKNILKITVPKIDRMINEALGDGALGAKIVGSGGGGSIVVISSLKDEQKIIQSILNAGAIDAYKVSIDSGARIIKNQI